MPQRTNPFQRLVYRIQCSLNLLGAQITESALITDYRTNTQTEVDILIKFETAGSVFQVGVECRDHSRPVGPPWIRELRTKREDCRLAKMIAVSRSGFSGPARILALQHGIDAIRLSDCEVVDWTTVLSPIPIGLEGAESYLIPDSFGIVSNFPAPLKFSKHLISKVRLATGEIVSMSDILDAANREVRLRALKTEFIGTTQPVPSEYLKVETWQFTVVFPPNAIAICQSNRQLAIQRIFGNAVVRKAFKLSGPLVHFNYGDIPVNTAEATLLGRQIKITASGENNAAGMHVEANDGCRFEKQDAESPRHPTKPSIGIYARPCILNNAPASSCSRTVRRRTT